MLSSYLHTSLCHCMFHLPTTLRNGICPPTLGLFSLYDSQTKYRLFISRAASCLPFSWKRTVFFVKYKLILSVAFHVVSSKRAWGHKWRNNWLTDWLVSWLAGCQVQNHLCLDSDFIYITLKFLSSVSDCYLEGSLYRWLKHFLIIHTYGTRPRPSRCSKSQNFNKKFWRRSPRTLNGISTYCMVPTQGYWYFTTSVYPTSYINSLLPQSLQISS
jgi:hypothetical protein